MRRPVSPACVTGLHRCHTHCCTQCLCTGIAGYLQQLWRPASPLQPQNSWPSAGAALHFSSSALRHCITSTLPKQHHIHHTQSLPIFRKDSLLYVQHRSHKLATPFAEQLKPTQVRITHPHNQSNLARHPCRSHIQNWCQGKSPSQRPWCHSLLHTQDGAQPALLCSARAQYTINCDGSTQDATLDFGGGSSRPSTTTHSWSCHTHCCQQHSIPHPTR